MGAAKIANMKPGTRTDLGLISTKSISTRVLRDGVSELKTAVAEASPPGR